ncbi:uncharacterized protein LACBIDRAFT_327155 [Laccaria bicolor S238N-H82]|uniref:Predicted protein n=1 Tax=Laccaria bicolor (strain S238N-H82 / ATCC MYA-4686) TaxID=486041 RepID=B0DBB8_LACBS|nr:uncharacterized protein LACBIDRAFT_327155 [Laccaria bicolor S238N-H82]EDR08164.1 predicted protein [Laccaria bicolor S238N-H82]|eukprot:XP_001881234.1 predicted protein [Laccaria bicolor S238N-H82]
MKKDDTTQLESVRLIAWQTLGKFNIAGLFQKYKVCTPVSWYLTESMAALCKNAAVIMKTRKRRPIPFHCIQFAFFVDYIPELKFFGLHLWYSVFLLTFTCRQGFSNKNTSAGALPILLNKLCDKKRVESPGNIDTM